MSFENIKKANESIMTLNVKGKEYAQVNERIKAFWQLCPEGRIETHIISVENGVCIIEAFVYENKDEEKPRATGIAYEKEGSTFINKTSYIENCETSAVGRALGNAGIGIDTSVASAEEVQNAILQQEGDKKISKTQAEALRQSIENSLLDVNGIDKEILSKYGYVEIKDIKIKDYGNIVNEFKKIKGE